MKKNYRVLCFILVLPLSLMAQRRNDAGLRGDAGAVSGFFDTDSPVNYPAGATSYWHLLDVRHTNTSNNFAMQFAGSFFNQELFFRKTNDNPSHPWSKVLLETNGKVGIGTANPTATLHVNGTQNLNGDLVFGADQTAFFIKGPANGGAIRIKSNGGVAEDRNVQFGNINNNGTWSSFMTVEENGFVGVGTVYPIGKFHVKGNTIIGNNDLIAGVKGSFVQIDQGAAEGDTYSQIRAFNSGGTTIGNLVLQNNGGNVGIGTTELIGYKLAVNGKIRAQEIKVEASPWPDYVFAKDYSLPTLQETEKHIKEKGHLPGIPSAEEVKANGIDLGDMNAKLLQKIEELTLHLIRLDKKVDELEVENKILKNRLK